MFLSYTIPVLSIIALTIFVVMLYSKDYYTRDNSYIPLTILGTLFVVFFLPAAAILASSNYITSKQATLFLFIPLLVDAMVVGIIYLTRGLFEDYRDSFCPKATDIQITLKQLIAISTTNPDAWEITKSYIYYRSQPWIMRDKVGFKNAAEYIKFLMYLRRERNQHNKKVSNQKQEEIIKHWQNDIAAFQSKVAQEREQALAQTATAIDNTLKNCNVRRK